MKTGTELRPHNLLPWKLLFSLSVPCAAALGAWGMYLLRPAPAQDWQAAVVGLRQELEEAKTSADAAFAKADDAVKAAQQQRAAPAATAKQSDEGRFKVVHASEFRLDDAEGKTRAALRLENNEPQLILLSEGGGGVVLDTRTDGPGLTVEDKNSRTRIGLHLLKEGPALTLYDGTSYLPVVMLATSSQLTGLGFQATDGNLRALLGTGEKRPRVYMNDQRSRTVVDVNAPDGKPSVTLLDQNGKARAVLGSPNREDIRDGTLTQRPPSSLLLLDQEGNVLWATPEKSGLHQVNRQASDELALAPPQKAT